MKVIDTIANISLTLAVIVLLTITATAQDKLLLSEIVITPTAGEYLEIYNPGGAPVDLTNYYITDATFAPGGTFYYNVVLSDAGVQGGGGGFGDFNARFPTGAMIAAGEFQTIALAGDSLFFIEYGVSPTYELYEDEIAADAIPDMLEADTGSVNGQGGLSSGEVAILYYWDGLTDLVTDIDYVVWQDKAEAVDKSGVSVDGPDVDATASMYANDVAVADQDAAPTHSGGFSMQRIDFTEGSQAATGSNGVGGASETSENLSATWYGKAVPTPNAAPEPVIQKLLISEYIVTPTSDEFIEIYNPGGINVDLTNYYLTDATFAPGGTFYYNIVSSDAGVQGGGGSFGDFNARFPSGSSIAPDEFQTISLSGSANFFASFGVNPTYELFEDSTAADAIPDMLEADTGSVNGQGGLSTGEVAILYYWNGMTDLVTDIDYVVWQDKAEAVDKSGVKRDGPDANPDSTLYANDVAVIDQETVPEHGFGFSSQRLDFTEGTQIMTGGNGVDGRDETSENLSVTWHADSVATPNGPPQPIIVPTIVKLLLTELVVTPTAAEFVEILNPSDSTVDLTNYYLTDATFQGGNTFYYQIVERDVVDQAGGGGGFGDWHAKFPDGAMIASGEYQTVALSGDSLFTDAYGVPPTYELYEDNAGVDSIPDMMEADTGSINGQGSMTNGDEVVILYFWDGLTDLVTDIDYLNYGGNNEQVDKTGVLIDGPDADPDSSMYAADVAILDQDQADSPASGFSVQRIDLAEGIQVLGGSNGVGGASETSENFSATWYAMSTPTPNLAHNVDYVDLTIAEMEVDADGDFIPDRVGQMVRITGVISTPNLQTSNTSHFVDDGFTGTDMFYFGQDSMFFMGDSVVIEGEVAFFAGVSEIIPVGGSAVTVLGHDAEIRVQTVPVATIMDVVGEDVEGEIVALDVPVSLVDEAAWPSGTASIDLWVTNGPDTVKMRLDSDIGMGGDPRPCGEFWLTGVVSQFAFNNPPNDNYSVIPRGFPDMVLLDAAVISAADDLGADAMITFTASPRDTAGAADAITEYTVMALLDNDSMEALGAVTADNSAEYSLTAPEPTGEAYIVVTANSADGCGIWSEAFYYNRIVGIGDEKLIPESYDLSANYPNPFNPTTKINYQLKENTQVKIVVFNLLGEQVAVLVDKELTAGSYITEWNGLSDSRKVLSSGIYFYRMTAGDFTKTNKMILLK